MCYVTMHEFIVIWTNWWSFVTCTYINKNKMVLYMPILGCQTKSKATPVWQEKFGKGL